MIKDFELVKKQLAELSQIVNAFKSEAVQLRIVELVFGATSEQDNDSEVEQDQLRQSPKKKKSPTSSQRAKAVGPQSATPEKTPKARSSGGATDVLRKLATDGFFKTPRLIGEIVDHSKVKLAKSFKPNELSPGLLKLIREKVLDRDKDEKTKQYKYRKA